MKINKLILIILILLILIFGISSISAIDYLNDDNSSENLIVNIEDNSDDILKFSNNVEDDLESSNDEELLSDSSKTIEVPFIVTKPNEVLWPRIQPAIDGANPGDTVIINGNPVHCHITINKTLNVVGKEGGTIGPCPHHTHEGVDEYGVFYIPEGGSGSLIQGFTFVNNDKSETPFSILIKGAKDIIIKDCTMNFISDEADKFSGLIIENANNIKLSNLLINNTIKGITIINSTNIEIFDCTFVNNENNAISIDEYSKNIQIMNNIISNNGNYGIKLLTANNITIKDNLIKFNGNDNSDSGSGIYVNTNITKLIVMGNIFLANNLHAIMYDYRARNLDNNEGADQLTIIDDNYFEGHKSMILHHRTYVEKDYGDLIYDEDNDIFLPSDNGNYVEGKSYVYMQNAFVVNDIICGFTYYTPSIPWSLNAPGNNGRYNLSLKLSEIKEVKNGVYQISIVNQKGEVATNFNSGHIVFFLNNYSTVESNPGDIYKEVKIQNGVVVADFRDTYSSFRSTNNVITAVFPALSQTVKNNPFVQLTVDDSNVPINPATYLSSSGLTLYPLSNGYISVKLMDSNHKSIAGQEIIFKCDGKSYIVKTDGNGIAKVKVSYSVKKTYLATFNFLGNDDYKSSKTTAKIIVKTGSKKSKIKSSNMKIKKNKKKSFKLKLVTANGKALKSQKVIVKFNGKTNIVTTNKKGIAKISIKLKKVKKYKINIKFLGNAVYKAVSKTNIVTVTKK